MGKPKPKCQITPNDKFFGLDIAKSGFQCTGILPLNPNIFTDLDFLPSAVTHVPMQSDAEVHHQTSTAEVNIRNDANADTPEDLSNDFDVNEKENVVTQTSTSQAILTVIHQLSPVPSAAAMRVVSRRRKAEKSEILTSSPYKNAFIENKATKAKPPVVKMQDLKGKKTNDPTKVKRSKKFTATPKTTISQTSKSSTSIAENATTCLLYQDDNDEDWICCQACNKWAHEACADVEKGSVTYICDFCRLYS